MPVKSHPLALYPELWCLSEHVLTGKACALPERQGKGALSSLTTSRQQDLVFFLSERWEYIIDRRTGEPLYPHRIVVGRVDFTRPCGGKINPLFLTTGAGLITCPYPETP